MQQAKNLSEYNKELREALDNTFLRGAMEKFATAYPVGRAFSTESIRFACISRPCGNERTIYSPWRSVS